MAERGRPTSYEPEFVNRVDDYLDTCVDEEDEFHKTRGTTSDSFEFVLKVDLPTIEGFALYLGVAKSSLYEWEKLYPDFSDALDRIKDEQKRRLINEGLSNRYNSTIAKLILSSNHGMAEKTETDLTSGGKPLVDAKKKASDVFDNEDN